jgi:hypothetical protein
MTKQTINVQQSKDLTSLRELRYKVLTTQNTHQYRIGEYLSRDQISCLIVDGVCVNIK